MKDSSQIEMVYYEVSGFCNARCPYCPNGAGTFSKSECRFIPPSEFSDGIQRLYELNLLPKKTPLGLFNWGEPFLHPAIDKILTILNNHEQKFSLSTNGSVFYPDFDESLFDNLERIRFSLPGFSQSSYDRIHKLNFLKVLQNIENWADFLPPHLFDVAFYLYRFNITEAEEAYRFFEKMDIPINFYMPMMMSIDQAIEYLTDSIDRDTKNTIEENLFTEFIRPSQISASDCACIFRNRDLIIDEFNRVLRCCVVSKNDPEYSVGSLMQMSRDEIIVSKNTQSKRCDTCFSARIPQYYSSSSKWLPHTLARKTDYYRSYMYIDSGNGFSNTDFIWKYVYPDRVSNTQRFLMPGSRNIQTVRWHPLGTFACDLIINEIRVQRMDGSEYIIPLSKIETNGVIDSMGNSINIHRINDNIWVKFPLDSPTHTINIFSYFITKEKELQLMEMQEKYHQIRNHPLWRNYEHFVHSYLPAQSRQRNIAEKIYYFCLNLKKQ